MSNADSFKYAGSKFDLTGTPLEGQFPNNLVGTGFHGLTYIPQDLDVTNYDIVNTYSIYDLAPFFWNSKTIHVSSRAQLPISFQGTASDRGVSQKDDVDLNFNDDLVSTRQPKNRVQRSVGLSTNRSETDNFDLEDLEPGELNPDYDPNDPNSEFYLVTPFDDVVCECRARHSANFITVVRCISNGEFIGYSFKEMASTYAKVLLASSGQIESLKIKVKGFYGLIDDVDDLLLSYDNLFNSQIKDLMTISTIASNINNGTGSSISVTELQGEADFTSTGLQNSPAGDETNFEGIDSVSSVDIFLNTPGFWTYA